MTLNEIFEGQVKPKEKQRPNNFVAKHAQTTGAGSHTPKSFTRKEKHPNKQADKDQE